MQASTTKHLGVFSKITAFCLLFALLLGGVGQAQAKHTKQHRQECLRNAQLVFFKAVDRALTTYVQRKQSCRNNITTVDNYLRCLNRAKASFDQAIRAARASYFRARLRCTGLKVWKGKDRILIPKHQLIKPLRK